MPGSENAVSAIMSVAVRYVSTEATSTPAGVSPIRSGATRPKNVALGIVSSANLGFRVRVRVRVTVRVRASASA